MKAKLYRTQADDAKFGKNAVSVNFFRALPLRDALGLRYVVSRLLGHFETIEAI